MRCEDCLPLIEEYFDGEVTGQTAETVSAHLSACADCSAALDALSFEQEVYARYDRGGLEVTPDLWARVSAEIARTPLVPESPAADRPFLSRARAYFAAALGVLVARPALASSLALLVVAAAAGTLWLSRKSGSTNVPSDVVATNTQPLAVNVEPTVPEKADRVTPPTVVSPTVNEGVLDETAEHAPREGGREVAVRPVASATGGVSEDELQRLLATTSAPALNQNLVVFGPEEHGGDKGPDFIEVGGQPGRLVAQSARPLDPDEKDVARHVERAQMLLRSIKNVRASDAGDVAYEKSLSRKLLAENATLQLDAEVRGDKDTKQVLDQIEPFLLEIANMGEKPSREEVRSIRERVSKNEIVAALEVY
jgi:hypothetical protein